MNMVRLGAEWAGGWGRKRTLLLIMVGGERDRTIETEFPDVSLRGPRSHERTRDRDGTISLGRVRYR